MKKRIGAVMICCMIALCIAACAKKDTQDPETGSTASSSASKGGKYTPSGSAASPGASGPSATNATPAGSGEPEITPGLPKPTGSYVIKDPEDKNDNTGPIIQPVPGVPTVKFSAQGGVYENEFSLTLTANDGYTIYYTTDGSNPKISGNQYSGPIQIQKSAGKAGPLTKSVASTFHYSAPASQTVGTVIKAYAKKGSASTDIITNTYIVANGFTGQYGLPSISISLAPNDFATANGIYISVMDHPFDDKERKIAFCEIFDRSGRKVSGQYAEFCMNGNGSLGNQQKGFRVYFKKDADPGVFNNPGKLKYDIFEGRVHDGNGDTITSYKRLIFRNSGNDCTSSMLRDALMHRLSKGLNFDIMESQPSLLFINGEFWGLYNIRERFDTKYFMAHYGVAEENIVTVDSPSPLVTGNGNSPYELNDGEKGDEIPFHNLVRYIRSHNLSNQTDYNYVASQMDIDNFIDYYIANLYFCNLDWPTNNVRVWRNKNPKDPSGYDTKWRFVMLDMDMGCGLAGQVHENMMGRINCGTIASDIMSGLMASENFKSKFIDRFIYIIDNVFTADKMIPVLDAMSKEIEAAEKLNIARWPSAGQSVSGWNNQISVIRNFLKNRSQYAKEDLYQYFNITPNDVSFVYTEGTAALKVDSADIAAGSTLLYDSGKILNISVTVKNGYSFAGIAVTGKDGKQTIYKNTNVNIAVSSKSTITVLTRKNGFRTDETLVAGSRDIFYLKSNGDLYAWGASEMGQCGALTGSAAMPVSIMMTSVRKVATSQGGNVGDAPFTLILTADNRLYAVGNNGNMQTGCSGNDYYTVKPMSGVPSGTIADISAGFDHTLILMSNGDLYGIGNNAYGQLGASSLGGTVHTFVRIATGVSSMAAGRRHSLYIADGKLYALGDNRWKKLTANSTEKYASPVLIATNMSRVFAGEHSSFCIDSSGDLYYFGWRSVSTFNAGESDGKLHKIFSGARSVSMQDEHAIIVASNGAVYGWGMNSYNQITTSSSASQAAALQIASSARAGAAGSWFSVILNADGSVTVWGKNTSGISGTGATSDKIGKTTIAAAKFNVG